MRGEDVEHDVGPSGAIGQRLGAGGFDHLKSVLKNRREDSDDLPISRRAARPWSRPAATD